MFRGLCIDWYPEAQVKTCERICKVSNPVCGTNQTCIPLFSNTSIGVCHTQPTCGDHVLDVVGAICRILGELAPGRCDDGNTNSGDGCSADCKTAELDQLCTQATTLALGIDFDTNEDGPTGYSSLCDPYVANPAKLYSFLPPAAGKLTLQLESAADLGLSALADCADSTSELVESRQTRYSSKSLWCEVP